MQIVSFKWTSKQVMDGSKTVTRRRWKKCTLKKGDLVQAYDKSPRNGGKKIAILKITDIRKELLQDITEEEVKKEGYEINREEFIDWWMGEYPDFTKNEKIWRIEFEKQ